ncbi:MAG: N-6 DNA methylase [candidate division WOR-3 bacterium]|nr:BREX-1 system adenine-specific DNA-methyltransferase PglX [Candidatus Omnitrophota bacterium]
MKDIKEILNKYKSAEKNKIYPFSEWHRNDIFEKLIKDLLITLGYNPDQINYDAKTGQVKLELPTHLKVIIYLSSIQEEQRFEASKEIAKNDTIPVGTEKPDYDIAIVTNFEKWFFYFDGKEIYALGAERLEKDYDILKQLISKDAIESGRFKEVARRLLHKEDNEPLRQELNILREKIANKILQEKINVRYLKNSDGLYNNELLNEITTRWITRFLSLKLAEDSGISFNFTLRDLRRSFELQGKTAKLGEGAKVKEETLSNAIKALMNDFERRFNGGIFMYEEGVDYITLPDSAFIDLLDFVIGWAFTIEDARIIGFVYERFLGQEIVVEEKQGKPEAILKNIGEARGRRKAGGIYYTPKYIVDYIVENTLGEILNEKRKEIDNAIKNLDCERFISILKEVKNLKVLDPACGSGSFLIKVLAEFKNFYEEAKSKIKELKVKINSLKKERTKGNLLFTDDKEVNKLLDEYIELEKEFEEIKFPGTFALRNNIYGVDIDPKAIDITAFTLMVQIYDELKEGARCPTMIGENLKVGNSLVSAIIPEKRNGFISRKELEKFKEDITKLIKLRETEKRIDLLDDSGLKKLIDENFDDVVEIYLHIKEKYPNAIPTSQQKLLDEWYKRAKKEPKEKTYDVLITQTGLARIFLKEVYFERIRKIKEKIENEINKPLIRYFNSEKRVLKDKEFEEILMDEERLKEELRFVKDRALEISKSQPPKAFNWEIEFPEVFFNEDGSLKENPGFDVVVGNPPYIPDLSSNEPFLTEYSKSFESDIDIYHTVPLFILKSQFLLRVNGFCSMIIPNGIGRSDSFSRTRRFLLNNIDLIEIVDEGNPFEEVVLEMITIKTCKRKAGELVKVKSRRLNVMFENIIKKEIWRELNRFILYADNLFLKIIKNGKINTISTSGNMVIGSAFLKNCKFKDSIPVITGRSTERYGIRPYNLEWVSEKWLKHNRKTHYQLLNEEVIVQTLHINEFRLVLKPKGVTVGDSSVIIYNNSSLSDKEIMAILNSTLFKFFTVRYIFSLSQLTFDLTSPSTRLLPIKETNPYQSLIISLVDAIISRKKEYHSIFQNIEDYIKLEDCNLLTLEDFIKRTIEDFEIISSIKVKNDNFDALRVRIEDNKAILEYGIKKKIEEFEIENEEEKKGRYIIDWSEAGRGKIKNKEAIEFLAKVLENEKRISKAKQKSIWQKIAEVKVPEFDEKVRKGFLNYKSAMEKAKKLDEEITKIDRAIDRLVYDLYGLTEEEIQIVEKSVWGEKFDEMYKKLPSKEDALKLAEEVKE